MHVVLHPQACYLEVRLDPEVIRALQLDVTAKTVRHALLAAAKLKLKPNRKLIAGGDALHVLPPDDVGGARPGGRAAAGWRAPRRTGARYPPAGAAHRGALRDRAGHPQREPRGDQRPGPGEVQPGGGGYELQAVMGAEAWTARAPPRTT